MLQGIINVFAIAGVIILALEGWERVARSVANRRDHTAQRAAQKARLAGYRKTLE